MTIFQIAAVLFALLMLYVVSIHGRKKTLSLMEVSLWSSMWVLFIVMALFPNLLLGIAHTLTFSRVFDLLLVMALMILTLLIFMSYFAQKEATKRLEHLVRQLAITSALTKTKKVGS